MLERYLKSLYEDTMRRAYDKAHALIGETIAPGVPVLDCGANRGDVFHRLHRERGLSRADYRGIEWHPESVTDARGNQLEVVQGDLNLSLTFQDAQFGCVYGLSVLEHLLGPCLFLRECHRVLQPGGRLVLLTPNISTYFTMALLLMGKMPSSGPHPDSNELQRHTELFRVSDHAANADVEGDTPVHRHLVVFSHRVLRDYLHLLGFKRVQGFGFGLYPFPVFAQPLLERVDPFHCHQMVFVATR